MRGRKFGVCVIIAHQRIGQLNQRLADALEADAGSFIAFRTGLRDSHRAEDRLGSWPPDDLMRLPTFQAAATISRDGMSTMPFTLTIAPPVQDDQTLRQRRDTLQRLSRAELTVDLSRLTIAGPDTALRILTTMSHLD